MTPQHAELVAAHVAALRRKTITRHSMFGDPGEYTDPVAWATADAITTLSAQLEAAQDALQFVERWANHHGQKDCISAEEALSVIQHYPPILDITRSYVDGKVPDTRNPFAELEAAQERIAALEGALRDYLAEYAVASAWQERFDALLHPTPDEGGSNGR